MSCPQRKTLSAFFDGELEDRALAAHVDGCETCQRAQGGERALGRLFADVTCPAPEELGLFIDDALEAERLERVAAHVLRCGECRDVVAWTREGQAQIKTSTKRRRRPRAVGRRSNDSTLVWLGAGVAAAAALLLVVLLSRGPRPMDQVAVEPPAPTPPQIETPQRPDEPQRPDTPDRPVTDDPSDPVEEAPEDEGPTSEPAPGEEAPTPEDSQPEPQDPAPPTGETDTRPPAPSAQAVAVLAMASSDVTWQHGGGPKSALVGARTVPSGSLLQARRWGSVRVDGAVWSLQAKASLTVTHSAVELVNGEALVDAETEALTIAGGQDTQLQPEAGARAYVSRDAHSFLVCMISGSAKLSVQGRDERLNPGESRRVRGGQARAVRKPAAVMTRAQALAAESVLRVGVDVPRGLTALRSLRAAHALSGVAGRARAALAIEALAAADPRLSMIATLEAAPDPNLAELADDADGARMASVTLALLARARGRRLDAATRDQVQATGAALAARSPAELLADPAALLALRAAERLAKLRVPRETWKAIAAAIRVERPEDLAAAILAKKKVPAPLRTRLLSELDATLAADETLSADRLWRLEQGLVLSGALTPEREARLVAHASRAAAAPELIPVLAHTAALAGARAPKAQGIASVVAVRVADRYHVTFRVTPATRPQQVFLVGSWDEWVQDATAMSDAGDGSFQVTLTLPARDLEYKIRLISGESDEWITDPENPLSAPDEQGRVNSLLPLGR